jgi:choline kinase
MSPTEGTDRQPQVLILAAGVGKRLGSAVSGVSRKPKAMLNFGGKSLMARHVAILNQLGLSQITVVIGFEAEDMRASLAPLGELPISIVMNPDFREGSVVSLWTARHVLRSGGEVILMDADVLYDQRLMARLIDSLHPNCLLLDREIEPGDEPVKLCIQGGRIVDFHKRPTEPHEWHGESVGFFRFTPDAAAELANRAEDYVSSGRRGMEYEEPIRDMMMASAGDRFGFEDISGLPWTEIDFPEDIVKAEALVPELVA